ncbi:MULTISPECIES: hypothetical protein [Paraburkholderia]|uniref:Uncharacterized protein n=2 Tax=Paraburkholderia TaxID=1822464 RepID=A0ABU9SF43_9BURK|nr:hypothetical protein [Paraburkholderia nodosa]HKR45429.1 hypothetical protein [Paraburkholderia sp.]
MVTIEGAGSMRAYRDERAAMRACCAAAALSKCVILSVADFTMSLLALVMTMGTFTQRACSQRDLSIS